MRLDGSNGAPVTLWLADVLALPALRRAQPELLVDGVARPVRWVHSSEIYEIAPLLRGGEVLLTTGLGLIGVDGDGLRRYAERIADRQVAAIGLELGRTFPTVPNELVDACAARELGLFALHTVVPFVDIAREANERILDHEAVRLRRAHEVSATLTDALLSGHSLGQLLTRIAELAGAPAWLVSTEGRVVAASAGGGQAAPTVQRCATPVSSLGQAWGEIVVEADDRPELRMLLERAAVVVQLALLRTRDMTRARGDVRRAVVLQLLDGGYASGDAITSQLAAAGVAPSSDTTLVGVAVTIAAPLRPAGAVAAVGAAAAEVFAAAAVADTSTAIVGVVRSAGGADAQIRDQLHVLVRGIDAWLAREGNSRVTCCAAGPFATDAEQLTASLRSARDAVDIARSLGLRQRIVRSTDVALHRLLARVGDHIEVERLIGDQLGALLDHDAHRGRSLLATLTAYSDAGWSKTATADALQIRRQTVYARLDRIAALLDVDLDDPMTRTSLAVAVIAWRIRRAGGLRTPGDVGGQTVI